MGSKPLLVSNLVINLQLDNQLYQLLYKNNCVILPGFGGFIGHNKSAEIIGSQGYIRQPHKSFSFNKNLNTNDGLVYNFIAQKLDITYNKAEEICKEFIQHMIVKLYNGESVILHNIGKLYVDIEKNIQFFPNQDENFALSSYGLKNISIHPINYQKKKDEIITPKVNQITLDVPTHEPIIISDTAPKSEKLFSSNDLRYQQSPRIQKRRIAAVFVLACCITASFLFIVNQNSEQGFGQQSSIFATLKNVLFEKKSEMVPIERIPIETSNPIIETAPIVAEIKTPITTPKTEIMADNKVVKPSSPLILDLETKTPVKSTNTIVENKTKVEKILEIKTVGKPKKPKSLDFIEVKLKTSNNLLIQDSNTNFLKNKQELETSSAPVKEENKSKEVVEIANLVFGSFKSKENAAVLVERLKKEGIKTKLIESGNGFQRVVMNTNTNNAEKLKAKYPGSWTLESIGK